MKKSFKCYVNMEHFDKTETDKRKIWRTDNILTHCCSFQASLFIGERNTKHNHYQGYSGYVNPKYVELIK